MRFLLLFITFLSLCFFNKVNAQADLSISVNMPDSICNGSSMPLEISVTNTSGITLSAGQIQVSWIEQGMANWEVETVTLSISAFGSVTHTFSTWIDVSTCGPNNFTVAVNTPLDPNSSNDTISFVIHDVCLLNPVSLVGDTVCATPNQVLEVDAFTGGGAGALDWWTSDDFGNTWTQHNANSEIFTYTNPQNGSIALAIYDGLGVCPDDTVKIILLPYPVFNFVNGSATLTACDNYTHIDLIVTNPAGMNDNVQWSTSGTGTISNPLNDTTEYYFSSADYADNDIWIYCNSIMPPQCPYEDSIKISWLPSPNGVITGPPVVCYGDTVTYTGSGGFSYIWYNNASGTTQNGSSYTFSPTSTDTLALFTVSPNSCSDTAFTIITVENVQVDAGPDLSACPGDVLSMNATTNSVGNPYSFMWGPIGFNDPTLSNPALTVMNDGVYWVTVTGPLGCQATDSILISFPAGVNIDFFPDTIICPGNTIILDVNATGNSVVWSPNQWISNPNDPSPAVNPPQTTLYIVTVDAGSCVFSDSILVRVEDFTTSLIMCDSFFCVGQSFDATMNSPIAQSYFWMVDGNFMSSTNTMSYLTQDVDSMMVQCEVTSMNGCIFMVNRMIYQGSELQCSDGEINNAFSPNGDGVNDTWVINILDGTTPNNVKILNRYGDVLVSFENYDNVNVVWDGTNKSGNALPSGVYFYEIQVEGEVVTGWVNISK